MTGSGADHLKVTCRLSAPLAGEPPQLDGLLEWAMSLHLGIQNERWKVDRQFPAPEPGSVPIPVMRERIGGWPVACCSSPIISEPETNAVEYLTKRLAVEHADLLAPEERKVVNTKGFWTKSYRLPLQVRRVERVVWFARGNRSGLVRLLKQVRAVGQRVAKGYGTVASWEVEKGAPPYWWYAPHPDGGTVLMRPLPLCDELPADLIGYRRTFGGCVPPLWHPARGTNLVEPV